MFIPSLKLLASPEQISHWLPLAESGKIIGTYCQTELGHGTFLRGLETTATFDQATDEFVIHSPTITSTKYWPGGLGYSSSHAIVMARLIISGRDYGVHPFIVQLRALDNYQPLPGIEFGDIGLKMGYNSNDNGYAVFTHLRIPRTQLLMGNARVLRDGTYKKAPHNKLAYSTMIFTRTLIISHMRLQLAQAATIAIRYSCAREQGNLGFDSANNAEETIMSFKSQHYRLLTIMARTFSLHFSAQHAQVLYHNLIRRQSNNDHTGLPYLHATVAGLKAYSTQITADGAEDARRCCGGHGYLAMSGFVDLVATTAALVTHEGENYVMYQQTARYLVKSATAVRAGQEIDKEMEYLNGHHLTRLRSDSDFLDADIQLTVFRHRASRLIFECTALLQESQTRDGLTSAEAWNKHMMSLIIAARAHIELIVLHAFVEAARAVEDAPTRAVLQSLCSLFALSSIESPYAIGALGFFEDGYISQDHLRIIRDRVNHLLEKLLPDAVALTDAWDFSDASLQSALGRKDGDVYETMMRWTRQVPLNQAAAKTGGVFQPGFEKYIRPILRSKL
ncbi:acyl-CoA dehydrogenase/oxidase C-terminal [Mycena rebaudengoi]|nr:acyl-CoA dehydrogenase/oxidase C-terminal [Mycena rebaudengoi]